MLPARGAKGNSMSIVSHRLSKRIVHAREHVGAVTSGSLGSADSAGSADTLTEQSTPTATLADLPIGARATIAGFGPGMRADIARRLFDLGFVPGTTVEAARRAPLRDPVIYRVSGVEVALRSTESGSVLLSAA
ncbi:MAG: FeoA family protein [Dermatophilus congolensis]|nr:FeoA family protein [Dermatophilus congolensis]